MQTIHILRPEPLLIRLERLDTWYLVPPPTRAQVREAVALDREDATAKESHREADERISRQLRALASEARLCTVVSDGEMIEAATPVEEATKGLEWAALNGEEEREILTAIITWHHGMDPAVSVATARALKKKALAEVLLADEQNASESSTGTPQPSPTTCASPSTQPSSSGLEKA